MAALEDTHLRRLVESKRPGMTQVELWRLTGEYKPFERFDKAAIQEKLPPRTLIDAVAEKIGVDPLQIVEACLLDAGFPVKPTYDREQHRAAQIIGSVPAGRRGGVVDGLDRMLRAMR